VDDGLPLIVFGLLKKLVVADNIAILVDRVFLLREPSLWLLLVGSVGFTVQILADFSGYTDIARGSARLMGIDLLENFRSPYRAVSPSDFWRRWHISLSTWIRDYIYIPLGGSRVGSRGRFLLVLLLTMGLSGLWHGAGSTFVVWGIYWGLLLFVYHLAGCGGRWRPRGIVPSAIAWLATMTFTVFGWFLFRAPSLGWVGGTFSHMSLGCTVEEFSAGAGYFGLMVFYALPMAMLSLVTGLCPRVRWVRAVFLGIALVLIIVLAPDSGQDFVYFRF
jgi:D-alanyl-lipoteichoic acid acyltransferase DltB (MBOAT superfamily)